MRYAVAILTFVPAQAPPGTRLRLPTALESLWATGYTGPLYVIDDGSTDDEHRQFLDEISVRVPVVRRSYNGGISRAKNTCLRVLSENGFDIGFIAEDDIAFSNGWLEAYISAHEATSIQHFSWAWDSDPSGRMCKELKEVHGFPIVATNLVNGVFLSLTPRVVNEVGGFRVMPAAWGHEHTHWTKRIIEAKLAPCFVDVVDSNKFIGINIHGADSAIPAEDRWHLARQNEEHANDLTTIYYPLIE